MTNYVQVIKECESAGGAGTKKAIQEALKTADAIAQKLIHYAMDPYRVYGVRKYDPPQKGTKAMAASAVACDHFFDTLDKLASRALTGDAAREAVTKSLENLPIGHQEYFARILDKDLKSGFSADTFNKVHPTNKIPTFEVMLADKCEDVEDFEKNITFPCQGDLKYDGERTIAVVTENQTFANGGAIDVIYYSRSGKVAEHVNGLFDEELSRLRAHLGYDFVLDGERYASNFTETMNAKKSGNDEAKKNLRFRAFFLMPLTDWVAQKTNITMRRNRAHLAEHLKLCLCSKIILSEGREVHNYQDMMSFCNEAIDVHGVEGLILKDWDATYQWDRTMAWCKVKRMYDVDCKVVGTYPGRPKSRLENMMGGIEVVGFLENGERIEAKVGSGFSDEDRLLDDWIGQVVVIKYQEVSRAKNKQVASLRFPVYERRRDDKDVTI